MRHLQFVLIALAVNVFGTAALAQSPPKTTRVGILVNGGPGPVIEAFRKDFARLGYVEGQNLVLEPRYAQGRLDRLPELAAELVRLDVNVILTLGGPASRAAKDATTKIPIVFSIVTDPIAIGLVASRARPGGNVTGITSLDPEQAVRQFELIKELIPKLARIAILSDATIPGADAAGLAPIDRANDAAARKLGIRPQIIKVPDGPKPDFESAFAAMLQEGAEAVLVLEVPVPFAHRKQVADLAAARRLPTIFPGGQSDAGGVIAYGTSVADTWPRMSIVADRILKGARPSEITVETITRRELVINLKEARNLGVVVPPALLKRADRILE
jgi:putative ABC transport system substrate-binding protein